MKERLLRLSLQHFADSAGGDNANGTQQAEDKETADGEQQSEHKPTFDDMLKDKDMQSEFDKRVSKALETAKAKWQKDADEKITEAKRLEKMNAEQKAQYEREKLDKQLAEREAAITKRELTATAKETLIEKGLPAELSSVLDYSSAENCSNSIDTLEKAFTEAVKKGVADKLRGNPPKMGQQKTESEPASLAEAIRMQAAAK